MRGLLDRLARLFEGETMDTPVLDAIRSVSASEWIALGHAALRIAAIIIAAWVVSKVANHAIRAPWGVSVPLPEETAASVSTRSAASSVVWSARWSW